MNDVAHWPLLNKNLLHKINIYTLLFLYLIRLKSLNLRHIRKSVTKGVRGGNNRDPRVKVGVGHDKDPTQSSGLERFKKKLMKWSWILGETINLAWCSEHVSYHKYQSIFTNRNKIHVHESISLSLQCYITVHGFRSLNSLITNFRGLDFFASDFYPRIHVYLCIT